MQRQSVAESAQELGIDEEAAEQLLGQSREVLYGVRARRPKPHLDDKVRGHDRNFYVAGYVHNDNACR